MSEPSHGGLRYFTGDDTVDWREYRRWKMWCMNKFLVMDKLPKEARGSFVWTLLQGKALEIVEHLKESEYQKEGGEKVIFALLDQRWPERERSDEMGENLTEIFHLHAKDGEQVRTWCARSRECFDRCQRKTGVSFPEEAKGWLLLHRSGMSEEQRAVVLARTVGDLKFDTLSTAMRSCFPEYVVPKKRAASHAAHYVEQEYDDDEWWYGAGQEPAGPEDEASFQDVELFLAEHDRTEAEGDWETYPEAEVAEVLATTWKDKRQELAKLQKARKFNQAGDLKRSFRIEVEELKRKTKCNRCGQIGHWARECRAKLPAGSSSAAGSQPTSAGLVQHFVCYALHAVAPPRTMLDRLRENHRAGSAQEVLLVSSPGFAVLDSGCGKSVIGLETLQEFRTIWERHGIAQPSEVPEVNVFKFGNGAQETSRRLIEMPVSLAGRRGLIRAAIIQGRAPLLLSRPALKTLGAQLDFGRDRLKFVGFDKEIEVSVNEAGQYVVPVAEFAVDETPLATKPSEDQEDDVMPGPNGCAAVIEDSWVYCEKDQQVIRKHVVPRVEAFTPCSEGCPVEVQRLENHRETRAKGLPAIVDNWRDAQAAHRSVSEEPWTGETVFRVRQEISAKPPEDVASEVPEHEVHMCEWTAHQWRQVKSAARRARKKSQAPEPRDDKVRIVEVFSPPRFSLEG